MPIESLCLLSPNKTTADVGTISFVLSFDLYGLCLFCLFVYDMITNVLPVSVVVSLFLKNEHRHSIGTRRYRYRYRHLFARYSFIRLAPDPLSQPFCFTVFFYLHLASHVARR
jgi:hypothetical protein